MPVERLLAHAGHGVQLNEHLEAEGPVVFEHACRMGLEGIVSKRRGSRYQSGCSLPLPRRHKRCRQK
jgi:bifunctional non-homologous end joining protein LigD